MKKGDGVVERKSSPDRLAHDLNNQLSIILGFCELLLENTPDGDPRKADIREIHEAARTATSLVASTLPDQPGAHELGVVRAGVMRKRIYEA